MTKKIPYNTTGMATMTVKSTFTLDKKTADSIRELAMNWKVSQAEVVRKSIQIAMNDTIEKKNRSPMTILKKLEKKKYSAKETLAFKNATEANKQGWDF